MESTDSLYIPSCASSYDTQPYYKIPLKSLEQTLGVELTRNVDRRKGTDRQTDRQGDSKIQPQT